MEKYTRPAHKVRAEIDLISVLIIVAAAGIVFGVALWLGWWLG